MGRADRRRHHPGRPTRRPRPAALDRPAGRARVGHVADPAPALVALALGHPRRGHRHPARDAHDPPHARAVGARAARRHPPRDLRAELRALHRRRPHRRGQPHDPAPARARGGVPARAHRGPRSHRRRRTGRAGAKPRSCSPRQTTPRRPATMAETRRLHPSAVAIYSADALRSAAFPIIAIVGIGCSAAARHPRAAAGTGLRRHRPRGLGRDRPAPLPDDDLLGRRRGDPSPHGHPQHHDTDIRLDRIEAIDIHQGPLQRAFGVFAVEVQTGAGRKAARSRCPR